MGKLLLKSETRAFMYKKQGFKNKEEFWSAVETKRAIRKEINKVTPIEKNLGYRYNELIPQENFKKVESIIFEAVGKPSFYRTKIQAGEARNSRYDNWYYDGQYSSKCTWGIKRHDFIVKAPRILKIEVPSFEGLYNLHCELMKETKGIKIYKASWIVKKRGFDFDVVSGYIAANEIISFHGDTVRTALEGFKKKMKKAAKKILAADTIINVKRFREVTGACESGCANFMAQHNIPANIKMTVWDAVDMLKEKGQGYYAQKLIAAVKGGMKNA